MLRERRYDISSFRAAAVQDEEKPSKTQRKRAMHELQALGERLVGLNPEQLASFALPDALREAVEQARRITRHEARRRQLQYVGRLMRDVDPEPIRERLKTWDGVSVAETARLHRIERWRDRLIEDDGAVASLAEVHPRMDTRHLRVLIRRAREERNAGSTPHSTRELFRTLRDILGEERAIDDHQE
jgi:ribosome-associated protein